MSKRAKPDEENVLRNLAEDLHNLVTNKLALRSACETFLNQLVDEITVGVIFDIHRKFKTDAYDLDVGHSLDDDDEDDLQDVDYYAHSKKSPRCSCPKCDKFFAVEKFAKHLEICMGIGRLCRTRKTNNSGGSGDSTSTANSIDSGMGMATSVPSDDERDADWRPGEGSKKKKRERNGGGGAGSLQRKNKGGTPSKRSFGMDGENAVGAMVVMNHKEDELTHLREVLRLEGHQGGLVSLSNGNSSTSNGTTVSERKKKSKHHHRKGSRNRDRSSPGGSVSSIGE